jgi:hypothetical protein
MTRGHVVAANRALTQTLELFVDNAIEYGAGRPLLSAVDKKLGY